MKILISPAKSLDFENNVETSISSKPIFADQALKINNTIKNLSAPDLSSLMNTVSYTHLTLPTMLPV